MNFGLFEAPAQKCLVPLGAQSPNQKASQATTREKRSRGRAQVLRGPGARARWGEQDSQGQRRLALDLLGWRPPWGAGGQGLGRVTIPLLLHSSLNRDKGPCQVGRKRPGHRRLRAGLAWMTFPLVKTLGPRSARGRQPSGPRRQVRGDFARPAAQSRTAHILKDRQPPLSRIDSNFLKRESADSMNQALPGERVAAPARNIHLQNNSFSRSELSANTLAGSPGTREEGGTGLGRRRLSTDLHSPPLSPTPALRDPEVAEAVPDTRAPLC